jgi:hypothetical protein
MTSQLRRTSGSDEAWTDRFNALERLIRWISPRTSGRDRVLQRLVEMKMAASDRWRLHHTVCLLSRDLDALYPQGPITQLARQRVRDIALMLAYP